MTIRISVVLFAFVVATTSEIATSQTPQTPAIPPNLAEIERREAAARAKAIAALQPGASWSYAITSLDRSLNGRAITVTYKERTAYAHLFDVTVDGGEAKSVVIDDHEAPWFVPIETGEGRFSIQSISAPSEVIGGKRMTWTSSKTDYVIEYGQPVPSRTVTLIGASLARPACLVPAGTFKCVELTMKQRAGAVQTTTRLQPDIPAALYYQMRRPQPKSGLITFKLASRKTAETNKPR